MKFKTAIRTLVRVIGIYLFTYAVLSTSGEYAGPVAFVKIPVRPVGSHTLQIHAWQPKYLVWRKNCWNLGGVCFAPVIKLDQAVWHQDEIIDPVREVTLKRGEPAKVESADDIYPVEPQVDECTQDIIHPVQGSV
jgi:hypothetical protein